MLSLAFLGLLQAEMTNSLPFLTLFWENKMHPKNATQIVTVVWFSVSANS